MKCEWSLLAKITLLTTLITLSAPKSESLEVDLKKPSPLVSC